MNPIQLSKHIHQAFVDYLSTIFDVNRDGQHATLQAAIQASFQAHNALMRGPYLEITPPYMKGQSIIELLNEGVLTREWAKLNNNNLPIPISASLYRHQEDAVRTYYAGHSMVISSGTGSGKTESFLIPILDDILRNPHQKGVRAVLIYPMNALVNDQLDRLRRLLKGTDITFGRYTSELDNLEKEGRKEDTLPNEVVSRETIRNGSLIPQILITNYAMLEYLLLRPEDSPLFESSGWRFLVLDEAHTYSGSQGIEVAYLIRRLKQRLNKRPGELLCIATSATLTDDIRVAAKFATDLFGENIEPQNIIIGKEDPQYIPEVNPEKVDPESYLAEELNDLLDEMKHPKCNLRDIAEELYKIGIVSSAFRQPSNVHTNISAYLWDALSGNPHLIDLRQNNAKQRTSELDSIANTLFGKSLKPEDQLRALYNLIELGNMARPDEQSAPMLSARYHVFMRPPQGIWVCLNPKCTGRQLNENEGWSRVFATKREHCDTCNSLVYPLVICRDCGQTYIKTSFSSGFYRGEGHDNNDKIRYLMWEVSKSNRALANESDDFNENEENEPNTNNNSIVNPDPIKVCINCGKENPKSCCKDPCVVDLLLITEIKRDSKKGQRNEPLNNINECIRCGAKAIRDTEIATPITVNGSTPLSILTTELYRNLPAVSEKPGNGRKLLTFYDSRQGAARFAAFLQDITNHQHYDHIIPSVVAEIEESKAYYPNLDSTAKYAVQRGWDERLYHHDEKYKNELKLDRKSPNQNDRETLNNLWQSIILSEFTTRRHRRQSLESMGVVGVKYFEDESEFEVSELASDLRFTSQQTRDLVEFLLDDIRHAKAIVFPNGVAIDDERFGRNISNPRLVKSNAQDKEIPWIGKTDRHRRKKYIQKALNKLGMNSDTKAVDGVLLSIWDWLTHSEILKGSPQKGYQLDYKNIFLSTNLDWSQCQQCQRLYARNGNLIPCPHPRCNGELKRVADVRAIQGHNYFYQNMQRAIIPMRVEEHTAQLDPNKGRKYQDEFRDGDINVLSCSTTFEMGIDLGDLQSVVMSNIPPTVANYRQRSGRAGRRAGGTAFILTWADERPHDQAYFRDPIKIIEGTIKVPHIALENSIIEQRHMNAVLLSDFLRYRKTSGYSELKKVKHFFEPNLTDRHYDALDSWIKNRLGSIQDILSEFISNGRNQVSIDKWLDSFKDDMRRVDSEYQKRYEYYTTALSSLIRKMTPDMSRSDINNSNDKQKEFTGLRDRLNQEELISFLSDKGVLPSYSFPLYTVELLLPVKHQSKELRLQRDLKQAIREYAPGAEIVADKYIWRSEGVRFYRGDMVRSKDYTICEHCNYIRISEVEGKSLKIDGTTCPVCHQNPKRGSKAIKRFVTPDDFFAGGKNNGVPATQYVNRLNNDMRSALIPNPEISEGREEILTYIDAIYERKGRLLYVNEGKHGQGFRLSLSGDNVGQITQKAEPVSLGHEQETDVLHLHFKDDLYFPIPGIEDQDFWLSLMYALIQGACKALQIERRDIDGVLSPKASSNGGWEQVIVLYDNVPGGAGHVKRIKNEFPLILRETLGILNCIDCSPDTSCYRCIRDYNNQIYHSQLKREKALKYLELIYHASQPNTYSIQGAGTVIATNPDYWLLQQVQHASYSVSMWVNDLSIEQISGSQYDWLDVLQDCLRRGVKVRVNLISSLDSNWVLIHYLKHLVNRYSQDFYLGKIDEMPLWHIRIDDEDDQNARAVRIEVDDNFISLGSSSIQTLVSTTHPEGIREVRNQLDKILIQPLHLPIEQHGTIVKSIDNGQSTTERELFGDYFRKPITKLWINDPYLTDRYRIVERLRTYIDLAEEQGYLQSVVVVTSPDDRNKPSQQQKSAFQTLSEKYGERIVIRYKGAEHDRFVHLTYQDGSKVRIIIGRGLDFIRSDGKCLKTYITISHEN